MEQGWRANAWQQTGACDAVTQARNARPGGWMRIAAARLAAWPVRAGRIGRAAGLPLGLALALAPMPFVAQARDAAPVHAAVAPGYAHALHGRVVRVADGDTFTLLDGKRQQRVRMASIDSPEMTKSREQPGQPHANAARTALSNLIAGKTLTLQCYEKDRYGRHICDVPLGGGDTANRRMVAQGMAWANREKRGAFLRDKAIDGLERTARAEGRGLWRDPEPIAPWVWRYQCWKQQQCR